MCLFLHSEHPSRDFRWLRRGFISDQGKLEGSQMYQLRQRALPLIKCQTVAA